MRSGAYMDLAGGGPVAVTRGIDLLVARGAYLDTLELADAGFDLGDALRVRIDLMKRLDRVCAGHTVYPGQGLFLGGATMYRFDR